MGLVVEILKTSGEREERTLVQVNGKPAEGPFDPTPERPAVLIDVGPVAPAVVYDAEPVELPAVGAPRWKRERRPDMVGPMADGRWIYTSDGRFNYQPLRYFDRWETSAQYASND